MDLSRRRFLETCLATGGASLLAAGPQTWAFTPVSVENPLGKYPDRDWEKVYLDQYRYDSTFTWVCAPNDTHMCRLRAFVRNGVMLRSEQNYDHDRCGDLYGNKATKAWNPRGCPKGYTMQRRVYGPYRLKGPVLRKGWKEWADDGFPSLSDQPELRTKYKFDDRGNDSYVRLTLGRSLQVRRRRPGGRRPDLQRRRKAPTRLTKDGYEQVDDRSGARGRHARRSRSARTCRSTAWSASSASIASPICWACWITTCAACRRRRPAVRATGTNTPGAATRLRAIRSCTACRPSDMDFNDMRFSKLVIQIGKNLIENKMPESHWLNEVMERGGKLVDIAPEYNCPGTKSDYWIWRPAGLVGHGRLAGRHEDPARREAGTTPISAAASPIFRCWSAPTRSSDCGRRMCTPTTSLKDIARRPVVQSARADGRAARSGSATFACGTPTTKQGRVRQPRRRRRQDDTCRRRSKARTR